MGANLDRLSGKTQSQRVSLQNGLLFVEDGAGARGPEWVDNQIFLSTDSCILICGLHEIDGECLVTLGSRADVRLERPADFTHILHTPSGAVRLSLVDTPEVMQIAVESDRTPVSIWINHPQWADEIVVGIG